MLQSSHYVQVISSVTQRQSKLMELQRQNRKTKEPNIGILRLQLYYSSNLCLKLQESQSFPDLLRLLVGLLLGKCLPLVKVTDCSHQLRWQEGKIMWSERFKQKKKKKRI